jgi:proteasome component ECM29
LIYFFFVYYLSSQILDYLRICLWFSAGANCLPGDEKKKHMVGNFIRKCQAESDLDAIEKYNNFIKKMIVARRGVTELNCLFDLVDSASDIIASNNADLMDSLAVALKEVSENNRSLVAKNYGILLAFKSNDTEFDEKVTELLALEQKSLEYKHGAVLAVSYAIHRRLLQNKKQATAKCPQYRESVALLCKFFMICKRGNGFDLSIYSLLAATLLSHPTALLISVAIQGLGLIGSAAALPLTNEDSMEVDGQISDSSIRSKPALVKKLFSLVQSGHTKAKVREESALCLGQLTVGDGTLVRTVLEGFLELIKMSKDPAMHIAMAQVIKQGKDGQ